MRSAVAILVGLALAACERSPTSAPASASASVPVPGSGSGSASASAFGAAPDAGGGFFGSVGAVALEDGNACFLVAKGDVRCAGDWPIAFETPSSSGSRNQALATPLSVSALPRGTTAALAVAENRGCAVLADATVRCWGNTNASKNGWSGATPGILTAVPVLGVEHATDVALAWNRSCAVREDHTVICWGPALESHGRVLGPADPPKVRALPPVTQISGGKSRFCARTTTGTVVCWTNDDGPAPVVAGLSDVTEVRVGGDSACALTTKGEVFCWGDNTNGTLGDGTTAARTGLVKVGVKDVVALDVSSVFACALGRDGTAWCWGEEANCDLGSGPKGACTTRTMGATTGPVTLTFCGPTALTPSVHGKHLTLGSTTACTWDDAGAVACWGLDPLDRGPQCTPRAL